jgi:hypothetical protein
VGQEFKDFLSLYENVLSYKRDLTAGMPSFLCDPIKFPRLSCKGILLVTISAVKFNLL